MTSKLEDLKSELRASAQQLKRIYDEAGPQLDFSRVTAANIGHAPDRAEYFGRLVATATKQRDELAALEEAERIIREHAGEQRAASGLVLPGQGGGQAPAFKAFRQQLEECEPVQLYRAKGRRPVPGDMIGKYSREEYDAIRYGFEAKTLITLSGINVAPERRAEIQPMALETAKVDDLFGRAETSNNTIQYYEETANTNAAAAVAEGTAKPESAVTYTLRTELVTKIATWIPATDELLADVPFMESTIRNRLLFWIDRERQREILNGSGTAPELRGILNRVGIQTTSGAAGSLSDNLLNAIVLVQSVGFAEPTGIIMHPHDYGTLRKLQTTAGGYIFGPPTGYTEFSVWGLPVRLTTGIAQGTALVGAFRTMAQIVDREAPVVTMSSEHSTYFVENKIALLAEERLALLCLRPAAFCTVTAIPA